MVLKDRNVIVSHITQDVQAEESSRSCTAISEDYRYKNRDICSDYRFANLANKKGKQKHRTKAITEIMYDDL